MEKYLVCSPHTKEECTQIIKDTMSIGYLTHYYWGCKAGDHCGWALIDADNESEALLSVPPYLRSKSKATKMVQFDPNVVQGW